MFAFLPALVSAAAPRVLQVVPGLAPDLVSKLTEDMLVLAQSGQLRGRAYGRDATLNKLTSLVTRCRGILLVCGSPGTGKTASIEELVYRVKDDQNPYLKNALFYRLKSKATSQPAGVLHQVESIFYGSQKSEIGALIDHLMQTARKKRQPTFLVVDEIHQLFQGDFSLLTERLAAFDEEFFMLIGMTSEVNLLQQLQGYGAELGCPLQRRVAGIDIPEMLEDEAITAFNKGKDELGRIHRVQIKECAIRAIVVLRDSCCPGEKLPGSARKFLEQVATFRRSEWLQPNSPEIEASTVFRFLSTTSSYAEGFFSGKFAEWESRQKLKASFFDDYFPSLTSAANGVQPIETLKCFTERLEKHLSDRSGVFVTPIHSKAFLRCALANTNQTIRCISLREILEFCRINPDGIKLVAESLQRLDQETLLVEHAETLIQHLSGGRSAQRYDSAATSYPSSLDSWASTFSGVTGGRVIIDAARQVVSQFTPPARSSSACSIPVSSGTDSQVLDLIKGWLEGREHRVILAISARDKESLQIGNRLQLPMIISSEKGSFIPVLFQWLKSRYANRSDIWLTKLIFLVHGFWDSKNFPADICDQLAHRFHQSVQIPTNDELAGEFSNLSGNRVAKQDALQFLTRFERLNVQDPMSGSLDLVSHALSQHLEGLLVHGKFLLKIGDRDHEKATYLARLAAKKTIRAGGSIIKLRALSQCFTHSEEMQLECLVYALQNSSKIVLLMNEWGLNAGSESFLKKAYELGCTVICAGAAKAPNQPETSQSSRYTDQLMNVGLSLLKSYLPIPPQQMEVSAQDRPPLSWLDTDFIPYQNPPFKEAEFRVYFADLWQAVKNGQNPKCPDDRQNDFLRAYFYLYQKKGLLLARMRQCLQSDILVNCVTQESVAERLAKQIGPTYKVSQEEILYEINPSLLPSLHRVKILVQKVAIKVFGVISQSVTYLIARMFQSTEWIVAASSLVMLFRTVRPWIWPAPPIR